ncbi:MAG: hypothetical protein ACTH2Q_07675 [Propionibacteriaceae bacterium]
MSTTATDPLTAPTRPVRDSRGPRLPLPRTARRIVLVGHLVAAGSWIGIDVLVAVLVGTARLTSDDRMAGLAYRALGTFVVWPMAASAVGCLLTGLLLGLGSRYGLLRYWWVLVKLVLTGILLVLILVVLRPGMAEVTAAGMGLEDGVAPGIDLTFLAFPPAVSLTTLAVAVVLSVFKPWGRTRTGHQ